MPGRRKSLPDSLSDGGFLMSEAAALDVGRGVLRGPGVIRLSRGLYVSAGCAQTHRMVLAALLKTLPRETAVDGVSALRLWGVEVGGELPYRFVTT